MHFNFQLIKKLLILLSSILAWWFVASGINPELHYFVQQSAFLTEGSFFHQFSRYPGGIADYFSEFVVQFFYFKWIGSLLIVFFASLLGIIAVDLVQRIAGQVKLSFSVFASVLLLSLLVQCNYYYPFYASIRLFITFGFVWIFTRLILKFSRLRYVFLFLMGVLLFYLAGGAALFVFAISAILIQIRFSGSKTDFLILPIFAGFSGVMPWIAYKYFFLVNFPLLYSVTHSKTPLIISYVPDFKLYALYSFLPVSLLLALLFYFFRNRKAKSKEPKELIPDATLSGKNRKKLAPIFWLAGQFVLIVLTGTIGVHYSVDQVKKNQLFVSFSAANRDWAQVIETAKNIPDYDLFTNVEYNRALANTGNLADSLFQYPQLAGSSGLFVDGTVTSDVPFICSDQYYDLGFMHESQHWTFEAQTMFPNSPRLMKRLVEINLVNGKYRLAEKFLNRLDQNLLYKNWVAKYRAYIQDTTLVGKDPELASKRNFEPSESFTASIHQLKLVKMLDANPANDMAFEYLQSSILLDGDLGLFVSQLNGHPTFRKYPLPRAWDEALVLYYYVARKMPAAGDVQFTRESQEKFRSFIKAMAPFGTDWQAAQKALKNEFGKTYWYYLKCLSPKVTKVQIKRQKFDD
ncbi:MAG: DUF6057 family protein [Prolixibacteraceae bacterium]